MWATTFPGLQLVSTNPGWVIESPTAPWSDLFNTWLLLRIKSTPPRVTRAPSVPEQQDLPLVSVELPPEVPSFTGAAWLWWVSFGNATVTMAVAVCVASDCNVAIMVAVWVGGNEAGA